MAQNPEWYGGSLVASAGGLITAAGDHARHTGHIANYDRVTAVRGLTLQNNASNPNTQLDVDCDMVSFRSTSGKNVVGSPSTLTLDMSVAGPTPNGRDQAAAFNANSWISIYYIYAPGTIRLLASTNHTHSGPNALPSGYTHWAYVTTVRLDSSGNLMRVVGRGAQLSYQALQPAVNGGTATTETSISVSGLVPPTAAEMRLLVEGRLSTTAGGGAESLLYISHIAANIYAELIVPTPGASQSSGNTVMIPLPNVGQQFLYRWSAGVGGFISGIAAYIYVMGYRVPNGDA